VAMQLQQKRLVVVSDGALQYIPFAALPAPNNPRMPLIVAHEIVNTPSASVLAVLRQEASQRKQPPKTVVVIADPVFSRNDARVGRTQAHDSPARPKSENAVAAQLSAHLARSVSDVGLSRLPRLGFSRREADAILATVPAGMGTKLVDFQASRANATKSNLANYRIVHFATHGLLDSTHPELSGLVLSLVDQDGKPQNGFLDLQDIYNLNLPADLVVLSACETALGTDIKGEGLVGLTRGFMYAGATRVIASLWKVDDVATSELMRSFYKSMQQGLPPAAALRHAQIEMRAQKRWALPYYWAGFQLQGEWK
jgi:CHAT domain-containing protein